ncbi:hypothetical protein AKJ65_01275 [candidate division MSBL1 archaeon SCGC-AAA259E19]|uniref:Uncharacterized protein n=1 Tax=candidate division MSBL1 archaeon SCGC-AAA259E19 TaxID=1698264 RepID=A0A133UNC7_9EURY|nr:hypothetical protein AKJ65_01275 [candidate division MSBL1 archaeon SCGC-AAA259E19]
MLGKTTRYHQQVALFAKQTRRKKEEARLARELLREKLEEYVEKQGPEEIVRAFTTSTSLKLYYCPRQDCILEVRNCKIKDIECPPEHYKLLDILKNTHFMRKKAGNKEDFLALRDAISLGYMKLGGEIEEKIKEIAEHFDPAEPFSLEGTSEVKFRSLCDEIRGEISLLSVSAAHLYRMYSETPDEFWEKVPLSHWLEGVGRWRFEKKHSSKTLPGPDLFRRLKKEKPAKLTAARLKGLVGGRYG